MKLFTTILALTSLTTFATATGADRHDVAPTFQVSQAATSGNYCGKCVLTGTGRLRELRTSKPANKCNTLDEGENYGSCTNQYCGLCVMFKDNDCQGDITYSDGGGAGPFNAKGARSYYCM